MQIAPIFAGSLVDSVRATVLGDEVHDDSISATLDYADGSTATIDYLGTASPVLAREVVELSGDG